MQGLPIGCIVEASLFCRFAVSFRFQSGSVSCPSIFNYMSLVCNDASLQLLGGTNYRFAKRLQKNIQLSNT